jgi:hypothetical protein
MLPGSLVSFVLTLLLVSTTPMGTGSGVHQFDLLHPLFSHVHIVNGRVLTHEQLDRQGEAALAQPVSSHVPGGPAIGAGLGADSADSGMGWSPTLPLHVASPVPGSPWAWIRLESRRPTSRVEAPPDPPPTSPAA